VSHLRDTTVRVSEIGYSVGVIDEGVWKGQVSDPFVVLFLPQTVGHHFDPQTARRLARSLTKWANAADPPKRRRH